MPQSTPQRVSCGVHDIIVFQEEHPPHPPPPPFSGVWERTSVENSSEEQGELEWLGLGAGASLVPPPPHSPSRARIYICMNSQVLCHKPQVPGPCLHGRGTEGNLKGVERGRTWASLPSSNVFLAFLAFCASSAIPATTDAAVPPCHLYQAFPSAPGSSGGAQMRGFLHFCLRWLLLPKHQLSLWKGLRAQPPGVPKSRNKAQWQQAVHQSPGRNRNEALLQSWAQAQEGVQVRVSTLEAREKLGI